MMIGIGFRQDILEAVALKNKICQYLQTQNIHILTVDVSGSQNDENEHPSLENMEQASQLLLQKQVDKLILVCRSGTSAKQAALNMNIPEQAIAKHGTVLAEHVSDYSIYTTGFSYDWEEIQCYLDQFIKESSGDEENRTPVL